ncbi:MAG: hypothetical protein IM461_16590, partial [Microcystis sp. M086S1]|nr:hypothetical protein [Microcystis sp. M086S1]
PRISSQRSQGVADLRGEVGSGEVGKWGSGEVGKLSHHPITPKPYHPIS